MPKIDGQSSRDRDDAFERVLREAREEAPVSAPIKEPSAAERARRPGRVARRRAARQARRRWRKTRGGGLSHERRRQVITWLVLIGIAGGLAALTQAHLRLPPLAGGNASDRAPVTHGPVPTLASPGGRLRQAGHEVLRIRSDFVFVYPVQRPGQPAVWVRVAARNDSIVDFSTWDDPGGDGVAEDRCDVNDGFVHPEFPSGAPDSVRPSGRPQNPCDLNTAPEKGPGCHLITGT